MNVLGPNFTRFIYTLTVVLIVGGVGLWAYGTFAVSSPLPKRILQLAGIVLISPVLIVAGMIGAQYLRDRPTEVEDTLKKEEAVEGIPFPAGTRVRFRSRHGELMGAMLPHPMVIENMKVSGWVSFSYRYDEQPPRPHISAASLEGDHVVQGVPCKGGTEVILGGQSGQVTSCMLSAPFQAAGAMWPAATKMYRFEDGTFDMHLPEQAPPVTVFGTSVPGGWEVRLTKDRLLNLIASAPVSGTTTVTVRGARMKRIVTFNEDDSVEGVLAEDAVIDGTSRKAEEFVTLKP